MRRNLRAQAAATIGPWGRILAPGLALRLGHVLGDAFARLPGQEQDRCREHLALAFPQRDRAWVAATTRRCFGHHVATALWTWATLDRDPAVLARGQPVEGRTGMRACLAAARAKRPTVIVSGHFGNWEFLARACGRFAALTVLGRRMRDPLLDRLVADLRTPTGNRYVFQDAGVMSCLRELRAGRVLATLPDQDIRRLAGCFVPWFGRPAWTPSGPAALAILSGTPLQPVFCYRRAGRWVMHFGPRRQPASFGAEREAAIVAATAWYTAYEESLVRRWPWQWVWWHRRWRTRPEEVTAAAGAASR